jgi:hypothetical protein
MRRGLVNTVLYVLSDWEERAQWVFHSSYHTPQRQKKIYTLLDWISKLLDSIVTYIVLLMHYKLYPKRCRILSRTDNYTDDQSDCTIYNLNLDRMQRPNPRLPLRAIQNSPKGFDTWFRHCLSVALAPKVVTPVLMYVDDRPRPYLINP